jgi:hypothetical protein
MLTKEGRDLMNEVFLIGKVIEDIEYKFMLKKRKNAKAKIELKLIDETKVEVVAYNEQADYTLQNIKIRNNVFVYGKLQNSEIVINKIIKI